MKLKPENTQISDKKEGKPRKTPSEKKEKIENVGYTYALDLSCTNTGIVLASSSCIYVTSLNFSRQFRSRGKTTHDRQFEKLRHISNIIHRFSQIYKPEGPVIVEDIFIQPSHRYSSEILLKLHGLVLEIFRGHQFLAYPPKTVKKTITGNGNADKEAVQTALKELYKIEFENDDQSDALAVYETYRRDKGLPFKHAVLLREKNIYEQLLQQSEFNGTEQPKYESRV